MLTANSTQKLSINENNLLRFPPKVSFSISFPSLLNYPLVSVETICISAETCGKRLCKLLLFFKAGFGIAVTLLIHDENKVVRQNIQLTLYALFFANVTIYKFNEETFKILLYFFFLKIFYRLTMKPKV